MKDNIFKVSPWNIQLRFFHQFFFAFITFPGLRARRDHAYQVRPGLVGRAMDQFGLPVAWFPRWIGWDWFSRSCGSCHMGWVICCLATFRFTAWHMMFFSSLTEFHCRQFRSELILYLFYLISWAVWCMAGRDSCPPPPTLADDLRSVAGGSLWLSEGS